MLGNVPTANPINMEIKLRARKIQCFCWWELRDVGGDGYMMVMMMMTNYDGDGDGELVTQLMSENNA